MELVEPVKITASVVTSTSVSASTKSEWLVGTAYVTGDTVKVTSKKTGSASDVIHHEYEALSNSTGVYPPDDVESDIPKWLDLGAENSWKMFDGGISTQTQDTTQIMVVMTPGGISTLALLNVMGASVTVTVENPVEVGDTGFSYTFPISMGGGNPVVYNQTKSLMADNVGNWWEYFYAPIIHKTDVLFEDIPYYSAGIMTVVIDNGIGETVACGLLVCGASSKLGKTIWGVELGIIDFSVKTVNPFGDAEWLRRSNSRRISSDVSIPWTDIDETYRLLSTYTATPVLWIASNLLSCTFTYGVFKDFKVIIPDFIASCSIEIEGLV